MSGAVKRVIYLSGRAGEESARPAGPLRAVPAVVAPLTGGFGLGVWWPGGASPDWDTSRAEVSAAARAPPARGPQLARLGAGGEACEPGEEMAES
jgi:hypothetical protein